MDQLLEATARAEARHFWFRGFRRFVRPLLKEGVAGRADPRILDCGCGTGAHLRLLAACGRTWGIELSWTGVEFARRHDRRIARASVTDLPFPDETFDLAVSFDVLYCLEDHEEERAVGEMFRVLRPGGAAIINVAAMPILRGVHSLVSHEVRRYRRADLRRLIDRAGFKIERLTHTNASLFPIMLAVRLAQRLGGLSVPADGGREIAVPPAPVNGILSALLAVEALALRWVDLPFGSSLLCLARRPPGDDERSVARHTSPACASSIAP